MNKAIEAANIDKLLNEACSATNKSQLDKVIGKCLRNPLAQVNELGRSLIKDLNSF
jgi:hypothetical protein